MLSCLFIAALLSPAGKRDDLLALVGDVYCIFVTFPCGILRQVWYLIVLFCFLIFAVFLTLNGFLGNGLFNKKPYESKNNHQLV